MSDLRVVVVDDEPLARERVSMLVRACDGLTLAGEGRNGLEALDLVAAHEPDVLFIDVEMPELSGLAVVAALEGRRVPAIVFITAYEQYALQAFEVGAVDYLHKPVTPARFAATVARVKDRLERRTSAEWQALVSGAAQAERARGHRTRFVLRRANTHYFVPVDDVDWIDVTDNYLQLHVGGRVHLWRGTMKQVEEELDPARFVRIHRSIVVAADRVSRLRALDSGGFEIEMRDGAKLRSSRSYSAHVRKLRRDSGLGARD